MVESWQWATLLFARLVLRGEQRVILYLLAENRVLREVLKKERGDKRLLLTVPQKRMLARFAKDLGRRAVGTFVPAGYAVELASTICCGEVFGPEANGPQAAGAAGSGFGDSVG